MTRQNRAQPRHTRRKRGPGVFLPALLSLVLPCGGCATVCNQKGCFQSGAVARGGHAGRDGSGFARGKQRVNAFSALLHPALDELQ